MSELVKDKETPVIIQADLENMYGQFNRSKAQEVVEKFCPVIYREMWCISNETPQMWFSGVTTGAGRVWARRSTWRQRLQKYKLGNLARIGIAEDTQLFRRVEELAAEWVCVTVLLEHGHEVHTSR